jgi:hypothetical protein
MERSHGELLVPMRLLYEKSIGNHVMIILSHQALHDRYGVIKEHDRTILDDSGRLNDYQGVRQQNSRPSSISLPEDTRNRGQVIV